MTEYYKIDILDDTGEQVVIPVIRELILSSASIPLACLYLENILKAMLAPTFDISFVREREREEQMIYLNVSITDQYEHTRNLVYGVYK
jgi:hypothetical protein